MALLFDTNTEKVVLPAISEVQAQDNMTVMSWVYLDSNSADGVIASNWANNNGNKGFLFFFDKSNGGGNKRISLIIGDSSTQRALSSTVAIVGFWHHWAIVKDGVADTLKVYMDGVLDATATGITMVSAVSGDVVRMGASGPQDGSTRSLKGRLAHNCFNNVALAQGEVRTAMRRGFSPRGLVYHHDLMSAEGGISRDLSGNKHNGTITGATVANHAPVSMFFFGFESPGRSAPAGGPTLISLAESGTGTDNPIISANLTQSESASGIENQSISAIISELEAATANDALQVAPGIPVSENGTGSETPEINANIPQAEAGSGSDSPGISAGIFQSETASGTENIQSDAKIPLLESGTANEAIQSDAGVPVSDFGSSIESLQNSAEIPLFESGIGNDPINVQQPGAVNISDSGLGVDAIALVVALTIPDAGLGAEIIDLAVEILIQQTASASDNFSVTVRLPNLPDTGTGLDTLSLLSALALAENALGAEGVLVGSALSILENGIGAEAVTAVPSSANIVINDISIAAETIDISAALTLSETGAMTELILIDTGLIPLIIKMAAVSMAVPKLANITMTTPKMANVTMI